MKISRILAPGMVTIAIFLCWLNAVNAGPSLWPNSKGEICLHNTTTGQYVRLAVLRTVGSNYVVHGLVTETAPDKNSLFNGNAIVDGNRVLIHVSSAGYTGDVNSSVTQVFGFIGRVELDAMTLTGWALGVEYSCPTENPQCDAFHYTGIQALEPAATCP